jgi:hypothetical protein
MEEQTNNKTFDSNLAVSKILEKGAAKYICPICSGKEFTVSDTPGTILTTKVLGSVQIGRHVPCAIMVCNNCGHLDFFALGSLGLLNEVKKDG